VKISVPSNPPNETTVTQVDKNDTSYTITNHNEPQEPRLNREERRRQTREKKRKAKKLARVGIVPVDKETAAKNRDELAKVLAFVLRTEFNGDKAAFDKWLGERNKHLHGMSPARMIAEGGAGRLVKLLRTELGREYDDLDAAMSQNETSQNETPQADTTARKP
jgi:hypothetical protein